MQNNKYKLSVIIPVYGVEKYIEKCARSLFEQTLDQIEFIFINDCTKDRSIDILKNVIKDYPHRHDDIKIMTMPKNSGQAAVRQVGMESAIGEYIIHCDSDDWIDPDAYRIMYEEAHNGNYDLVFCDYCIVSDKQTKIVKRKVSNGSQDIVSLLVCSQIWTLWGALVKRDICIKNQIRYPGADNGEDMALMVQIASYAKTYKHIPSPLYYYRVDNNQSITNNVTVAGFLKRINNLYSNTNLIIDFFKDNNLSDKYCDLIVYLKLLCKVNFVTYTFDFGLKEIWNSFYPELKLINVLQVRLIPFRFKLYFMYLTLRFRLGL